MTAIQGTTDPRFARLRDALAGILADDGYGAAVAVTIDGKPVADLWGGHADAARTRPWQADTVANVWSVTKGVMALGVAMQVERGKLAYDRPIAGVWPEFAANGKGAITLETALSHQAGLNGLATPMDLAGLYRWTPYVDALAAMAPLWEPGSRFVYHALSFGHLAGEPLRRVTGHMPRRLIAEEIAGPLNADFSDRIARGRRAARRRTDRRRWRIRLGRRRHSRPLSAFGCKSGGHGHAAEQ